MNLYNAILNLHFSHIYFNKFIANALEPNVSEEEFQLISINSFHELGVKVGKIHNYIRKNVGMEEKQKIFNLWICQLGMKKKIIEIWEIMNSDSSYFGKKF